MSTRSAGTSPNARRRISEDDLRWADVLMVMEHKHRDRIVAAFPDLAELLLIHVLDIPDEYREMDPELVELLTLVVPTLLHQE
ncbi:phosphotyrosine protein phosphatase [Lysobacter brunescens]|uniref:Phosphotyrosine protein phosphatase n=1 Tax=Lysobacter brunescens TaxID=262323 RepID=A0ABW2Y854_9GAMM